jgi:hypothetical protein
MEAVIRVADALKSFRVRNGLHERQRHLTLDNFIQETRLSTLRTPAEFFDIHRISRPADFNTAFSVSLVGCCIPEDSAETELVAAHI